MAHGFGAWGYLPFVVPLFAFVALRLGALACSGPAARTSDQAVAGVTLAFAAAIASVRGLSLVDAVAPGPLLGMLGLAALTLGLTGREHRFVWPTPSKGLTFAPLYLVALAGVAYVTLAARWLPVWQWDSLGYHLPIVHFALEARSLSGVPRALDYIGTYPHAVELFFIALRACLPDDRLIDLGQLPFGLGGAVIVAALARRFDASPPAVLAAGAAWIVVPAVFLQLPTNYVDVATAMFLLAACYFALGAPSTRNLLLGSVALGLFLGSKPSAPVPALLLFAVLAWGMKSVGAGRILVAALVAFALGSETYLANVFRHHNPVWPVRFDLGPLHVPGRYPMSELLAAGAAAPRVTGPLPWRVLRSMLALTSTPVFDMRVGGFGPLFLLAVPFAIATLVQRRSPRLWLIVALTLVSPDPAVARYVLAFPAIVLATASPWLDRVTQRPRFALGLVAFALAAFQLVYAAPGLTGEGPKLATYAHLTDDERALAVGADGRPLDVARARARVQPGEAFAFDENMDLCDLAWDPSQSYRVVLVDTDAAEAAIDETATRERIRVLAVGDDAAFGVFARTHPLQFERLSALPSCRKGSCSLYARR